MGTRNCVCVCIHTHIADETAVCVWYIIRQTQIPSFLDSWVTNKPFGQNFLSP